MEHIVTVENISKKFKIYSNPWKRALEWLTFGGAHFHEEFWALKDISFNLKRGECLGIIGANGAGKSTLLKILTRALYPTNGSFQIHGRTLSLLELGTGFNPELTGRQNLLNSSNLLGFPINYIKDKVIDIEEFSELKSFFDKPIKLYSTGMYVRLAFSMFAFLEPDVLIIDEALSVGDIFFQQRSFSKIRDIISNGTTCIFVSHDTVAVQNLCKNVIFLEKGQIAFLGDADEAVSRYYSSVGSRCKNNSTKKQIEKKNLPNFNEPFMDPFEIIEHNILVNEERRHGAKGIEIVAARVMDQNGYDTLNVEMSGDLIFFLLLRANESVFNPSAGIHLFDRLGNLVFATGSRQMRKRLPDLSAGDELIVKIVLKLDVQSGEYTFSLGTSEPSDEGPNIGFIHDRYELLGPIVVNADRSMLMPFYGIARLPVNIEYCIADKSNRKVVNE